MPASAWCPWRLTYVLCYGCGDYSTYDTVYSNQFYHSSLDNSDHANAVRLLAHHTHRRGIC